MTADIIILLVGAGLVGGIITAVVGGASLVTFPAMLAAGLPPILANSSNAIAMFPGNLAALLADRERLPRFDARLCGLMALCALGGAGGAWLLTVTPERVFVAIVPVLLAFATASFVGAAPLRRRLAARREKRGGTGGALAAAGFPAAFGLSSLYGGYFGAGLGVIFLALLSVAGHDDYRRANALKNILSSMVSVAAVGLFLLHGLLDWAATLTMMAGVLFGGYAGGRLARIMPLGIVRIVVAVIGAALSVTYAWRFWF